MTDPGSSQDFPADELTDRQRDAIPLLFGRTRTDAAAAIGIDRRTLYGWLDQPAFRGAYEEEARRRRELATISAQAASDEAIDFLMGILTDPEASESGKLRAAHLLLRAGEQSVVQAILDGQDSLRSEVRTLHAVG